MESRIRHTYHFTTQIYCCEVFSSILDITSLTCIRILFFFFFKEQSIFLIFLPVFQWSLTLCPLYLYSLCFTHWIFTHSVSLLIVLSFPSFPSWK